MAGSTPSPRQAAAINGCTGLALTKLDALDSLIEVPDGHGLRSGRAGDRHVPSNTRLQERATTVYETLPAGGSRRGTCGAGTLPAEARAYADGSKS